MLKGESGSHWELNITLISLSSFSLIHQREARLAKVKNQLYSFTLDGVMFPVDS